MSSMFLDSFFTFRRHLRELPFEVAHRARNPGLRSDHRLIPDLDMIDYTHLTGKDHFVADPSAAGDANLSGNDRIFPYYHVVRDLNQVIYLRSLADNGAP